MARTINNPGEMTVLGYKDFVSITHYPFVGNSLAETLQLMVRFAHKKKVELPVLLNKLSGSMFAIHLTSKIYGDIRRHIPRLEKVIIPSILFDFIDSSVTQANLTMTEHEITLIKMLHLSIFKQWDAVVEQRVPAVFERQTKFAPTDEELLSDMIRVRIASSVKDIDAVSLPREKISAAIVIKTLNEMYVSLHNAVITTHNVADQFRTVIDIVKEWANGELKMTQLLGHSVFQSMISNFSLIKMAMDSNNTNSLTHKDGWFINSALEAMSEYLRSDQADIQLYRISDVASVVSIYRFINDHTKQVKKVTMIPNMRDVKFVHWFSRGINIGTDFSLFTSHRDPSELIEKVFSGMSISFLEDQLLKTSADVVQMMSDLSSGFTFRTLVDPDLEADFVIFSAMAKSDSVIINDRSMEYNYRVDSSVVITKEHSVGTYEFGGMARSSSPVSVLAYSGKVIDASRPYPIRTQTIEKAASEYFVMSDQVESYVRPLSTVYSIKDRYYENGLLAGKVKSLTLGDIIYNGDPISLLNVATSPALATTVSRLMNEIVNELTVAENSPHIRSRLFMTIWASIRDISQQPNFIYAASNFRRFMDIEVDLVRPEEAAKNYVLSTISMFRMLYALSTGVSIDVPNSFVNAIFEGGIDVVGLLTDAEMIRLST